jgi:restriction endonuclease Mrr
LGIDVYDLKERLRLQAVDQSEEEEDPRIKILDGEDLLELMEERARMAVQVKAKLLAHRYVHTCSTRM